MNGYLITKYSSYNENIRIFKYVLTFNYILFLIQRRFDNFLNILIYKLTLF